MNRPIISGLVEELLLSLSIRNGSFTVSELCLLRELKEQTFPLSLKLLIGRLSLGSIRVYDRHTENTVYPVLVQPSKKQLERIPQKRRKSKIQTDKKKRQ